MKKNLIGKQFTASIGSTVYTIADNELEHMVTITWGKHSAPYFVTHVESYFRKNMWTEVKQETPATTQTQLF